MKDSEWLAENFKFLEERTNFINKGIEDFKQKANFSKEEEKMFDLLLQIMYQKGEIDAYMTDIYRASLLEDLQNNDKTDGTEETS